jgi:hypothetical protein
LASFVALSVRLRWPCPWIGVQLDLAVTSRRARWRQKIASVASKIEMTERSETLLDKRFSMGTGSSTQSWNPSS